MQMHICLYILLIGAQYLLFFKAQYNTDMLQMYSMIDRRVEILGYSMKVFAKVGGTCINSA